MEQRKQMDASRPVMDSLAQILLSQNTNDVQSLQAFESLKAAYPVWDDVRTAAPVSGPPSSCELVDVDECLLVSSPAES